MAAKHLRAVTTADKPGPVDTYTVVTAASKGSRLDLLVAMRDRVATAVEDAATPARDLAALTRRLLEMAKEIEILQASARKAAEDAEVSADEAFDAAAI